MANLFDITGLNLASEMTERLVSTNEIRIERIVSKGQSSPKDFWYDQSEHEWVVVLSGYGVIEFADGRNITLHKGDYLNISAHEKHRLAKTAPDIETVWLAIFYH